MQRMVETLASKRLPFDGGAMTGANWYWRQMKRTGAVVAAWLTAVVVVLGFYGFGTWLISSGIGWDVSVALVTLAAALKILPLSLSRLTMAREVKRRARSVRITHSKRGSARDKQEQDRQLDAS